MLVLLHFPFLVYFDFPGGLLKLFQPPVLSFFGGGGYKTLTLNGVINADSNGALR